MTLVLYFSVSHISIGLDADALFKRLSNIIQKVELADFEQSGKLCFPIANVKYLGFADEIELKYILRYFILANAC